MFVGFSGKTQEMDREENILMEAMEDEGDIETVDTQFVYCSRHVV